MKVLIHEWVTGGGLAGSALPASWAAEGHAMRRTIAADFRAVDGVEVVATLDERYARRERDGSSVRIGPGEEIDILSRLARRCDYTVLIAPETGGILASHAALIENAGGRSLGSAPSAVILTSYKYITSRYVAQRGVRTPRTLLLDAGSGLPRDFDYPAVVKPVDGAGCLDTYYCETAEDIRFAAGLSRPMVIQPYSPGRPLSATFLIGPSGTIRLVGVGWQRIEVSEGAFTYRGGRLPAPAEYSLGGPLAAVRSVEGLRGHVGVDFVHDDATGETTVIEINPRPTTSYVGLSRLLPPGSIARAWLDLFSGRECHDDLRGMIDPASSAQIEFSSDGRVTSGRGKGSDDDLG